MLQSTLHYLLIPLLNLHIPVEVDKARVNLGSSFGFYQEDIKKNNCHL